ncbi:daptide-type RiPP biosynthesis methyltransferase [Microbacterium mangrovi]|uniref:daptide-type RiPP biosynthesis methyltransferase n=1 Tax=Microbacterium mangrovi TaxID=1348253 RepID=UPI00068D04BE|nr:daptide-type RiPP biosynthesis methyltransferase [Microbacterium mangrovi]
MTGAAPTALYSGRGAELYDRIVAGDRAELREILRRIDRRNLSVLELACGSGRITLPLLARGAEVTAVDLSEDLLARLRMRAGRNPRLHAIQGDILCWETDRRFDRVVLGTTSISLFDSSERRRLMTRVRRWLSPSGELLLTLRVPRDRSNNRHEVEPGLQLREVYDPERRTLTATLAHTAPDGSVAEYSVTTHLLELDELRDELAAGGLEVVDETGIPPAPGAAPVGDHRLLTARRAPRPASFEFFRPPSAWGGVEAVAARGTTVTFRDGSEAICAISGIWNASLGYGNERIAHAVHRANLDASALPLFRRGSSYAREAAARLRAWAGSDRFAAVFFSTSGSAALDAAVKLSRQVGKLAHGPARRRVVSLVGSYHGITSSSMALSGVYLFQDVYDADERWHIKIPQDDPRALDVVMQRHGDQIAAVVVEPVLGSGAHPLPGAMLEALQRHRAQHGFLLVADEVATGFYRTGTRFASDSWTPGPDILITSKALTNGTCAASALLVSPDALAVLDDADAVFWHGETQAGSPQSCAAILATIAEFERLDIASTVHALSDALAAGIGAIADSSGRLSTTGCGAMRALRIRHEDGRDLSTDEVLDLVTRCRIAGVVVQPSPSAIQFMPALTMPLEVLEEAIGRVSLCVSEFLAEPA